MGYIESFQIDSEGAGWVPFDSLSFSDKVEVQLALDTNTVQLACFVCFAPIQAGNACTTHANVRGAITL